MKNITKIVITGGPCAGKTTALSRIEEHFTKIGYKVLFVSEVATELITGGLAPWTCGSNLDYQKCQVSMQLYKEKMFEQAAYTMPDEKILIVCDRGALDNKAYMNDAEFAEVLTTVGSNEVVLRDSYDGVFHLVTAAYGAEKFYTLSNNEARTETVEEARALDDKIVSAWTGHPHLRIIGNGQDFDKKLAELIREISSLLGEPKPLEIERKFLIEYPDLAYLNSLDTCERVHILQTYLIDKEGVKIRLRKRGNDGAYIYFKTQKKRINALTSIELEERLSKDRYKALLNKSYEQVYPLEKDRYCLVYKNEYFEIDIYPFWKEQAIMEIELTEEGEQVDLPDFIKVIREVTGDSQFSNYKLAKMYGEQCHE